MEVSVAFARQEFCAGSVVTALVRGRGAFATVTAAARGQLQVDQRWVKVSTAGLFSSATGPAQTPGVLVFATARETVVPVSALAEKNGVVVQFDLPSDALPSFRGLCQTCTYNLAVTVTLPNSEQSSPRTLLFPFTVVSRGCSSSTPFATRFAAMSVFAASALPQDSVLVPPPQSRASPRCRGVDGDEDNDEDDEDEEDEDDVGERKGSEVYNISNKGHICSVSLARSSLQGRLEGGGVLALRFSFLPPDVQKGEEQGHEQQLQPCKAVRARLLQCEARLDGSRVQERPLALSTLPTTDCVAATLSLPLPSGCPCDFSSPVNRVTHRLEVDFFLDATGQPFCWSLPIEVFPPRSAGGGALAAAADINAALEAAVVTVERL